MRIPCPLIVWREWNTLQDWKFYNIIARASLKIFSDLSNRWKYSILFPWSYSLPPPWEALKESNCCLNVLRSISYPFPFKRFSTRRNYEFFYLSLVDYVKYMFYEPWAVQNRFKSVSPKRYLFYFIKTTEEQESTKKNNLQFWIKTENKLLENTIF